MGQCGGREGEGKGKGKVGIFWGVRGGGIKRGGNKAKKKGGMIPDKNESGVNMRMRVRSTGRMASDPIHGKVKKSQGERGVKNVPNLKLDIRARGWWEWGGEALVGVRT